VGRFERYLRRAGILTDELVEEAVSDALARMKQGIAAVEALPPPDREALFAHAYVDPPGSLRDG
jgi:TPP-dependent pyruvate/acetoin dehydrogenase alpha subunit